MRILFVGGVHGDERSGLRVCQMHGCTLDSPYAEETHGKDTAGFLIANTEACRRGVHYLDDNLNDCFGRKDGKDGSHEMSLQKKLISEYGRGSGKFADIVVDMHSSEENTDMLMFPKPDTPPAIIKIAADAGLTPYMCTNDADGRYCGQYLGKRGVTVEMNCINGKDDIDVIRKLDSIVRSFIKDHGSRFSGSIDGLEFAKEISFPKKNGKFLGWPDCCVTVRDMRDIHKGDPIIINPMTGKTLTESDGSYVPLFSNVPDYYEFGEAVTLAVRTSFSIK